MLEYLRNAADKPVAKFLMGVLIFSFVGWGVADWVLGLGSSSDTLMRVGGDKISITQYNNAKKTEIDKLSREQQRELRTKPATMVALKDRAIKQVAAQHRKFKHAQDLGYIVSDKYVISEIHETPQFQQNGEFSLDTFDVVLRNSGLTADIVANDIRLKALDKMENMPVTTPIETPQFAALATYNARNKTRNIDFVTVKFSDFNAGTPTEEQLREFYTQNPQKIQETRSISYVLVAADMDKPDESEAASEVAKKLEEDLFSGESLELAELAEKHNAKFVSYENISADNLPSDKVLNDDEVIAQVFSMVEGEESNLIESEENGFLILRIDKVTPEHDAEFESVKKSLAGGWVRAEQRKKAYVRANEILVDLNQNGKMPKKRTVNVSRTDGAPLPLLAAAFKNPIGDNSIVEGEDEFYILHIVDEMMPQVDNKKLDAITKDMENMSAKHVEADYDSYLERKYPIKMNKKTYNNL